MRASNLALMIHHTITKNIQKPIMIWGAPGIGKSDIVRQASNLENESRETKNFKLWDFRAALRDPVDLMGLPYIHNNNTCYAKPSGMPQNDDDEGILFLDEITSAPLQVQAALYQLMLDRAIGSYTLPKNIHVVAAGNRLTDRGVVNRMPDPLIDRFLTHVTLEVNASDWIQWALKNNIRADSIGYVRFRPDNLHVQKHDRESIAFATPRGHADVSHIRDMNLPKDIENEMIRGRVGDMVGGELIAYFKLVDEMVSPDECLLNPSTANVPDNASILYALAIALARRSMQKTFDAVMIYANRMPKEYAQALVSEATRNTPTLCNTRAFIAWAASNE